MNNFKHRWSPQPHLLNGVNGSANGSPNGSNGSPNGSSSRKGSPHHGFPKFLDELLYKLSQQNMATLILILLGVTSTLRLLFHELKCQDSVWFSGMSLIHIHTGSDAPDAKPSCPRLPPIPPLKSRYELAAMLEQMNFTTGVEIGVQQGLFADHNLQNWPSCTKYKLVDLWAHQENYFDGANFDNQGHETFYQQTKERLARFAHKTEYYRMYSSEAAKLIAKEGQLLDFVYVDARHDYCGVKEDMELYWPLVKPGGIMAGHDFMENSEVAPQDWSVCMDGSIHPEAVKGAVMEFANKHNLPVAVTYREPEWNSWWFQKPLC